MSDTDTLVTFLNSHRASEGGIKTHTSAPTADLGAGSYWIREDELDRFYDLYYDYVDGGKSVWVIELSSTYSPIRIDLDLLYDKNQRKNLHTQDHVLQFSKRYISELRKYVEVPTDLDVYVMEKKRTTPKVDKNDELIGQSGGIHLLIPDIVTNKLVRNEIRNELQKQNIIEEIFGSLPLKKKDVFDEPSNWSLYGSRKSNWGDNRYLVTYKLRFTEDDIEVIPAENSEITLDNIKLLSTRVLDDSKATPFTDAGKERFSTLPDTSGNVRISGGAAVRASRGRPAERRIPGSRESSPSHGVVIQPLSEHERQLYRQLVLALASHRADEYAEWRDVGQCLKNIHPDLYDEFEEFSRQNDKFDICGCIRQWNSFSYRVEGPQLREGSLWRWVLEDNPERFKEIKELDIRHWIDSSVGGSEYDVARVVYAVYRETFKCVSFGKNVWYKYIGPIWIELDRGVQLQQELSKKIWTEFHKRATDWGKKIDELGEAGKCDSRDPKKCAKDGCKGCEYSLKQTALLHVCEKLKTTKYKENVMKECKELFLDESFVKKVDEDRTLLACRNGVFDMGTLEFREGKQDDYLSFTTNLDIDPDLHYSSYPGWAEVDEFIRRVLPNEIVREYFMRHISLCLAGLGCQRFHILTGSGSNGKSMLMNLIETALGDYACKVPISLITQQRNKSSAASPEIVRLKGRRFVTMQEPDEAVPINTGLMKEITSSEKILARDLFAGSKQMIEFELQCKFHLACNHKPKVNTNDGGTWRRLIVINFLSKFVLHPGPGQFKLDTSVESKVKSEHWGRPFLAYLIHLYKEYKGAMPSPPDVVLEYTNEYREENDAITKFVCECTRPIVEGEIVVPVRKEMITDTFKQWWESNRGTRDWKIAEMLMNVETAYGKYQRGGWKNFQIQQDEE